MDSFIIANVERLENELFLVVVLYGDDGYIADRVIVPYENAESAVITIAEVAYKVDVWSSDTTLYKAMLEVPGLNGIIKHPDDTSETGRQIEELMQILRQEFERPALPRWRKWLSSLFRRMTRLIEGDGKYEI
ncbi:hypothetical protein ABES25_04705 [Bacillus gobiensis]|uniref:hypothetical protein n=1 Tax=Bacillus gobiensis TaxID=1441095 RepID=UPI003D1B4B4F